MDWISGANDWGLLYTSLPKPTATWSLLLLKALYSVWYFICCYFAALFPVDVLLCAGQRGDGFDFLHYTFSMQASQCETFSCMWGCLIFIYFIVENKKQDSRNIQVETILWLLVWILMVVCIVFWLVVKLRLVVRVLMGVRTSFLILAKDGMLPFSCKTIMSWMEGAPP